MPSSEFWEFQEFEYKISNMGIPVSFLELRRDQKWPVLNGWESDGMESGWSRMLETENFPENLGKNLIAKKRDGECRPLPQTVFLDRKKSQLRK